MHGTVVEHGTEAHNNRLYKICGKKTNCIITRTACHIKHILVAAEQYLANGVTKAENLSKGDNGVIRPVNIYSMAQVRAFCTHTQKADI